MTRFLCIVLIAFSFILAADGKVLIWEVSAPGQPGKAYLAGSIHSGKAQWYPLDAAYDRAFDASSVIYFEIYKPDQQEVRQKLLFYGLFRDGKTLSQVLGMTDYQQVWDFYAKYPREAPGMNSGVLQSFRPWLLSVQIAQIYLARHPEIRREFGLENVFTKHIGNKTPRSLETVDGQLQAVSSISDAAAGRMLMDGIRDFEQAGRDLNRIFRALETGDSAELASIANEMAFKHPEFHRELFVRRNERIAKQIFELLKEKQTVFILVGAGHLAGKGNILDSLRDKGCTTVQIKRLNKPGRIRP